MRNYQLITLCSEHLRETKILIQSDNRGRFAKFDIQSDDLIKELDEDIRTLRNEGYESFNVVFVPAYLIFNKNKSTLYNICNSLSLGQPPIEEIIPSLKGSKLIIFNADDQNMKIEL